MVNCVPEPVQPDPDCPSCASLSKQVVELTKLVKQLLATVKRQARKIAQLEAKTKATSSGDGNRNLTHLANET